MAEKRSRASYEGFTEPTNKKVKSSASKSRLPPVIHQQQSSLDEQEIKRESTHTESAGGSGLEKARTNGSTTVATARLPSGPSATLKQLLETIMDQEKASDSDEHVFQYTRKLHKLLFDPDESSTAVSATLSALDSQHPTTVSHSPITSAMPSSNGASISSTDLANSEPKLPPLPPITDPAYATAPFTHSSFRSDTSLNYERLEFLGDAYIEIIATRLIFSRFPKLATGAQAQIRESMVKNETLATYAWQYDFSSRAIAADTAKEQKKIMADMFEAYVAAIILSDPVSGYATAEKWLTALWSPILLKVNRDSLTGQSGSAHDDKARLNSLLLAPKIKLEYRELQPVRLDKKAGKYWYEVGVFLTGWGYENRLLGRGGGNSKALAGSEAAKQAWRTSEDVIEDARRQKEGLYAAKAAASASASAVS